MTERIEELERHIESLRLVAANRAPGLAHAARNALSAAADLRRLLGRVPPPRCGAYARSTGKPCQAAGLGKGGRCRNHGGCSTGARTAEGRDRLRQTWRKIGRAAALCRWRPEEGRKLLASIREASAMEPYLP